MPIDEYEEEYPETIGPKRTKMYLTLAMATKPADRTVAPPPQLRPPQLRTFAATAGGSGRDAGKGSAFVASVAHMMSDGDGTAALTAQLIAAPLSPVATEGAMATLPCATASHHRSTSASVSLSKISQILKVSHASEGKGALAEALKRVYMSRGSPVAMTEGAEANRSFAQPVLAATKGIPTLINVQPPTPRRTTATNVSPLVGETKRKANAAVFVPSGMAAVPSHDVSSRSTSHLKSVLIICTPRS
jgi:hypothetical protein